MSGYLHPFVTAAATLFDQHGYTYDLSEGSLVAGFANPLRHSLSVTAHERGVAVLAKLDASIHKRHAVDALLITNGFSRQYFAPQAYLERFDDRLHPVAAISLPMFAFDALRATDTVGRFLNAIGTWVEWWARHTESLELSPIERWCLAGIDSPWAELLAEAGFVPEDADGIDDIEDFASELLLEHCKSSATTSNS